MSVDLSCSIVLYNNQPETLDGLINALLESGPYIRIYLIDNSKTDILRHQWKNGNIQYIFNNANLGYGKGHNIAIQNAMQEGIKYHIVLNPDIELHPSAIKALYDYMEKTPDVGLLMPKIVYSDGSIQRLCKLLPTPLDLIIRRFLPKSAWLDKRNARYELHNFSYNEVINTACLSGCFMFVRTEIFAKSGIFDPGYFMYMEDYDLTRRIHRHARTIFYPYVTVVHGHNKESYKNPKLLRIHIRSAIRYFNKWGWFWDAERNTFNKRVLAQINSSEVCRDQPRENALGSSPTQRL